MSICIIWVDQSHAKLFQVTGEKTEMKALKAHHTDHHTHSMDRLDQSQQDRKFFGEVAHEILFAEQILIVGPGVAKHHFQTYLVEHHPVLARKVAGCETVDHPTDNEIVALAKKFFKIGPTLAHTA